MAKLGVQVWMAPEKLWQAINSMFFNQQGAQIGLVNINLGETAHPEVEQAVLNDVGTYGRQLGRIGDAMEVLVNHLDRTKLSQEETDILKEFEGQLAAVRKAKRQAGRRA